MFSSYRNQSADLQSKSTDWFLYDGDRVIKRLNIQGIYLKSIVKIKFLQGSLFDCWVWLPGSFITKNEFS